MDLKSNFKKAAQELLGAPDAAAEKLVEKREEQPVKKTADPAPVRPEPVPVQAAEKPQTATVISFEPAVLPGRNQRTVIAAGDVLKGSLHCAGCVDLFGEMEGNITGNGDLRLSGKLSGDAVGHNVEIHGGHIIGDITASGCAGVDSDAMVAGNIRAKDLTVNGKVKGNLEVENMLTMGETAVVLGKVSVGRISIADGAAFQGEVAIRSAEFDKFFSEQGKASEKRSV
ncbi:MAG: hypothetical protein EOM52_04755 [Clostridia bacterium]|nr:hypothetical protein [Clostridia bacterium]